MNFVQITPQKPKKNVYLNNFSKILQLIFQKILKDNLTIIVLLLKIRQKFKKLLQLK